MEVNETYFKVNSMTLDDFIENDPIADALYYLMVMIKQSPNAIQIFTPYETIFREARMITIDAYEAKHPEIDFDEKVAQRLQRNYGFGADVAIILSVVYSSLSLCSSLPKNLSMFKDVTYAYMQHYYGQTSNVFPAFEKLVVDQRKQGHSYVVEDLIGVERPAEPTPATKDWKTITNHYNKESIKKCVLSTALSPEDRLKTLDAIEAQYNLDRLSDPCLGSGIFLSFFSNLRNVVSLDLNDGSLPEISETRRIRRLKKKIDEQNEEITGLKRTVKDRDAEIKTLNKNIAKANTEIQSLHGKIDRLSEDNSDKKESAEAKTDDNGYRTRKVTTTVIQKLLAPKLAANGKEHTMSDLAKVIGYLTNYSPEKIRQDLSDPNLLTSAHKKEVAEVNKLFKDIGIDLGLKTPAK